MGQGCPEDFDVTCERGGMCNGIHGNGFRRVSGEGAIVRDFCEAFLDLQKMRCLEEVPQGHSSGIPAPAELLCKASSGAYGCRWMTQYDTQITD